MGSVLDWFGTGLNPGSAAGSTATGGRGPLQRLVEAVGANMALWHVLFLICLSSPVACALASAQRGRYGPGGYALAIVVGLAVAVCCGWVMYATHKVVGEKLHRFDSETSLA